MAEFDKTVVVIDAGTDPETVQLSCCTVSLSCLF